MDLDQQSQLIIFVSIKTTLESSNVFEAGAKIGLSLKPSHHMQFQLVKIHETLCIIERFTDCAS